MKATLAAALAVSLFLATAVHAQQHAADPSALAPRAPLTAMGYMTVVDANNTVVGYVQGFALLPVGVFFNATMIALKLGARVLVLGVADFDSGSMVGMEIVGYSALDCRGTPLVVSRLFSTLPQAVSVDQNGIVWGGAEDATTSTFSGKSYTAGLGCSNGDFSTPGVPAVRIVNLNGRWTPPFHLR